jgi:DNA-binding beta-propeller fold protein YncE
VREAIKVKGKIWKLLGLLLIMIFTFSTAASVHASSLITTITLHNGPVGVAYDPSTHEVFVANAVSGDIQVFSDSNNTQVADITALAQYASPPYNMAYDSGKGEIWVTSETGAYAISDATDTVAANVTSLASSITRDSPMGIAYDSGKGELFVTFSIYGVQIISDISDTVIANITTSNAVGSLAYDSAKAEIFAGETNETSAACDIAVISDQTNQIVTTIPVSNLLGSLVYDSSKGEIFALISSAIDVVSDSSNKVVATIPISDLTIESYMAYDSSKGAVYVNEGSMVLVISDSTNTLVGTVNDNGTASELNGGLGGVAYDSGTGTIYAINNGGLDAIPGSLAVIPDSIIPEFSSVALILTLIFATSAIVLAARKLQDHRIFKTMK